tara:strand:+ start:532 stop:807 length:276 start_codon:yes stop_codon:yes gene_type:complete
MTRVAKIMAWFDQAHERAGWLIIVFGLGLTTASVVALLRGMAVQWQLVGVLVGLVALGVITLLGVSYFNGLELGREGFKVSNWSREKDTEE